MLQFFRRKIYPFRLVTVTLSFLLAFYLADTLFFHDRQLFGLPSVHTPSGAFFVTHLGPLGLGGLAGAVVYIWLPQLFLFIQRSVSDFITKIVFQTLNEFFKEQNRRIAEARLAAEKSRVEKEQKRAEEKARLAAEKQAAVEQKKRLDEMCGMFSVVVDTSALIDGRVLALARSGFLDYPLIVSQRVIDELQRLADNDDKQKRERGRFGLDNLNNLKKLKTPRVVVLTREEAGTEPVVDKQLIKLSQRQRAKLLTVDFNLNKAAMAAGVKTLNLNDLASSVKTVLLPGERLRIKLTSPGKDQTQGVGYLHDGTMVVVERAGDRLGQEIEVEVTRLLQTPAGKMFFSRVASNE